MVDGKTLSDARFLQFIYGEKANGFKGLNDPSIACLILSNLNRAVGLHESLRLHELPLRFMIRDYGLPPDLPSPSTALRAS
jgi:hypothetical protein